MSATTETAVESLAGTSRAATEARWLDGLQRGHRRWRWWWLAGALATLLGVVLLYGGLASVLVAALQPGSAAPSVLVWAGLAAGVALRFLGGLARDHGGQGLSAAVRHALRSRGLAAATRQGPFVLAAQGSTAWWAQRHLDQVDALHGYFARYLPARDGARILPLAVLAMVFSLDAIAGLLLLIALPLVPVLMALIGWGTQSVQEAQQAREAALGAELLQRLETLPWLRRVGALEESNAAVADAAHAHRGLVMRVLRVAFLSSSILELFSALAIGLVALYVGFALLGLITFGPAASLDAWTGFFVLMLAPEAFLPLRQLAQAYHERSAALAATSLLSGLDGDDRHGDARAMPALPTIDDEVLVFDAVHHGYGPSKRGVLAGFDLRLRRGEVVGLAGPSGSGKSTALALAAGFLSPEAGRVARCARFAWVAQRVPLFPGTVRDNLQLACDASADDGVLLAALASVGLDASTRALSKGLETVIGEGGVGVSGGQAQRLGVARALLSGAPLWLLDEPTAALDDVNRDRLLDTLFPLVRDSGVAVLVASHDPALLARCDRAFTLGDPGRTR